MSKEMMKEITELCERNGESLSTVLGECCCLTGKAGLEAREIFTRVFDSLVQDKGIRVGFSKLLSEEVWDESPIYESVRLGLSAVQTGVKDFGQCLAGLDKPNKTRTDRGKLYFDIL